MSENNDKSDKSSGLWEQTKQLAQTAFKDIANTYQEVLLQDSSVSPNHTLIQEIEQQNNLEQEHSAPNQSEISQHEHDRSQPDIEPER